MGDKLAVAIVHGIGRTEKTFADGMMRALRDRLADRCGDAAADDVLMEPVYWGDEVEARERELYDRVGLRGALAWEDTRRIFVSFAGDAIAYQRRPDDSRVYGDVHAAFAKTLATLAARAGPTAPLCVVAHSLGTIITSNYVYDLQEEFGRGRAILPDAVRATMGPSPTPLERGETLTHLFTMGSPLAVWGLAYRSADPARDFGTPITVPAAALARHHPSLAQLGGWINLYDKQDVIAYPLKGLNDAHRAAVKEDREVNVGGIPISLTPFAHTKYWGDRDVIRIVGDALAAAWTTLNPLARAAP